MKSKHLLILFLVVVLLAAGSFSVLAWTWRGKGTGEGIGMGKWGNRFMHKLDLTDAQRNKFLDQKAELEKQMIDYRTKNRELRAEISGELRKDNPNRRTIHKYIDQINRNRTAMQKKRMDHILNLQKQLTPEQRKKFKEFCDGRGGGRFRKGRRGR